MLKAQPLTADALLRRPRDLQVAIVDGSALMPRHHDTVAGMLPELRPPSTGRLHVYCSSHAPIGEFAAEEADALRFMLARRPGSAFRLADVPSEQRIPMARMLLAKGVLQFVLSPQSRNHSQTATNNSGALDDTLGVGTHGSARESETSWAYNMRRASASAGASAGASASAS